MISSVGSSEMRKLASSERPAVGGSALISTLFSCRIRESWSALANVGTSVVNSMFGLALPGGSTSRLNSPEIVSPREEISLTLPFSTCSTKVGL